MPVLLLSRLAEADLEQIGDYIALDNPTAAEAFITGIVESCELLAASPKMGRDRSDLRANARSFPVDHYIVFYQTVPGGIEVIPGLHGARDIRSL
jgi:toxin ParE1/3/4